VLFLGWAVNQNLVKMDADTGAWTCNLVVSPLFEMISDLNNMPEVTGCTRTPGLRHPYTRPETPVYPD
jgi:hypothetical protein